MSAAVQGAHVVIRPYVNELGSNSGSVIEVDGVDVGAHVTHAVLTIPVDEPPKLELTCVVEDSEVELQRADVHYYQVCANCAGELNPVTPEPLERPWRTGSKNPRIIYAARGGRMLGAMDSPELTALVVAAVNGYKPTPAGAPEMCPSGTGHVLTRVFRPERGVGGKHYCECGWEL